MNIHQKFAFASCLVCAFGSSVPVLAADAPRFAFDESSLILNGRRQFLVSGEFHYFRVPKAEWRHRLRLLKQVGGNCVATYVPWILHEPTEGDIRFGDVPERDLAGFLDAVAAEGLVAMVRPGPYQYSELVYEGLPRWLIDGHPEILKRHPDGRTVALTSVDYNNPVFLAKVRDYFKGVAKVLKPYLAANGGPVVLVQLDNEMTGVHVWRGYRPTVAYAENCAAYLDTLRGYLVAEGVTGPFCHNAATAMMSASYEKSVARLGTRDFLLGYDHYYGLFQGDRESPGPYYFMEALFACDMMRGHGYPPIGMEIQCGNIGDVPPILREDALACYMVNLACGAKGLNYYVFTGGPNPKGLGNTCDIYDYHAPVAADGSLRETYFALGDFGAFVAAHPELLDARRVASVRLALEWLHPADMSAYDRDFNRSGMLYALLQTPFHPEYYIVRGEIPRDGKPLVLAGMTTLSAEAQRRIADFVLAGGSLLVAPDFPRQDASGKPCTILADAVGAPKVRPSTVNVAAFPKVTIGGTGFYGLNPKWTLENGAFDRVWTAGKGKVAFLGCTWRTHHFAQADMVGRLVASLGAKPIVSSSNRNVFTVAHRLKDGRLGVFALNLRTGRQSTVVTLPNGASHRFDLAPMSVSYAIP